MDKPVFRPIQSPTVNQHPYRMSKAVKTEDQSFSHHLRTALADGNQLTISKHASERLTQRGIHIDEDRWVQIGEKIAEAKKMGVNDSLVLLEDAALIISAKNNTVITAMDRKEVSAQIFTNINGTIIMES